MYAQFFGSYLLSREAATPEQMKEAIAKLSNARIKLGTLAMHKGLMTAEEVDEVCYLQTREDKRFGEIAVERDYLTDAQVSDLLKSQNPDYLLLGQTLVDMDVLTNAELEELLLAYQKDSEISDMNVESTEKASQLIRKFLEKSHKDVSENALMYINLMFNNLVRFIGEDFTPMTPVACTEYPINYCVTQKVTGPVSCVSRLDMTEDVALKFASRYAKMDFDQFDEYVRASVEDFLNLHNGLFSVNMSNEKSIELTLEPPMAEEGDTLTLPAGSYVIPVVYPFGTVHLIVSV